MVLAFALAFVLTTSLSVTAFGESGEYAEHGENAVIKPAPDTGDVISLSSEASGISQLAIDEARGQLTDILGSYDVKAMRSPSAKPPVTQLLKDGKPVDGDACALGSIYWNPATYSPTGDVGNAFQQGGTMAGRANTFTISGRNQDVFFATVPSYSGDLAGNQAQFNALGLVPGTYAMIPAGIASRYGSSFEPENLWSEGNCDNMWDVNDPPFQYTHAYNKAATFTDRVIYQKWTVNETSPGAIDSIRYWELDTSAKWYQDFNFKLKGYVSYYGDGGGNTTKWLDNGAAYPSYTPTRKGFKFGGWFTQFPVGGAKIVPGKTQVWFGEGYNKSVYVHWDKTVKITFNPNKGKITKGKKVTKAKYRGKLGKAPTAKRSGYTSLGWYYGSTSNGYKLHEKGLIVLVPKAAFKAQWIKNGKGKTVSGSEWNRILQSYKKKLFINYKSVGAAIGGKGVYNGEVNHYVGSDGLYNYYIKCKEYEWNGNIDGTIVKMYFSVKTGNLINGTRSGGLK
jgi:hypothetical protein